MPTQLTANFTLEEFQEASTRTLTAAALTNARWFATNILEPARRVFGPIRVTSFLRPAGGLTVSGNTSAHGDGYAVDLVPLQASVVDVHRWLARNKAQYFAELLLERSESTGVFDHIHVSKPRLGQPTGEVLEQQPSGAFAFWDDPANPDPQYLQVSSSDAGELGPTGPPHQLVIVVVGAAIVFLALMLFDGR